jgi:hypothetical protein
MARKFHNAFSANKEEDGVLRLPPEDTPLLEDTPRFCLMPAPRTATIAQPDALGEITVAPNDFIELRLSCLSPIQDVVDPDIDMNMDADKKVNFHLIYPTTTLPDAIYHCNNIFDLLAILRRLTPSQRESIHTFLIRWYTAECALWEYDYPDHTSKVSSGAFEMLTGLRKIQVDCEGECDEDAWDMKWGTDEWIGENVEVEMVRSKGERWKEWDRMIEGKKGG